MGINSQMKKLQKKYNQAIFSDKPLIKGPKIKIKLELSKPQKKHHQALLWLLDPSTLRASGRTILMAYVFLEIGIIHINTWVKVFDHYPDHEGVIRMLDTICRLADSSKIGVVVSRINLSFKVTGRVE